MTDPAQAERDFDSTVLRLLLDANVPWSVEEIVRELQDRDARDSVARLTSAGLVNRAGELVFPARAARRAGRTGDCRLTAASRPAGATRGRGAASPRPGAVEGTSGADPPKASRALSSSLWGRHKGRVARSCSGLGDDRVATPDPGIAPLHVLVDVGLRVVGLAPLVAR